MIKKPFFGFSKPHLCYERLTRQTKEPQLISESGRITLLLEIPCVRKDSILIKPGDKVKAGQKITLYEDSQQYIISTSAGTINSISPYTGDFGKQYTEIQINKDPEQKFDEQFSLACENPDLKTAEDFLVNIAGKPNIAALCNPDKPINTIVINCVDVDPLITTNLYAAIAQSESLKAGIAVLKQITSINDIFITAPKDIFQNYGHLGAKVKDVNNQYPAGNPKMIMKDVFGKTVEAGKSCEDLGFAFFSAEAAAAIGQAFQTKQIPINKLVTVIDKHGTQVLVSVKTGTPISVILDDLNVTVQDNDRIIIGGPMTGAAVFSEDYPVCADTDAIIIQDNENIPFISDYSCINCGECIRACPVNIPVNLLVRFLEAGQYQEAADEYDLYSCIDCGLCSYVCVSQMPVFQYIKLAKYELSRIETEPVEVEETTEETDDENNG